MFTLKKVFPGLPEIERGRPFCITCDPTGKKIAYGVANSVVIRDTEDPSISEVITHHSKKVTCVSFAPSGFYICSGDVSGAIKIWDTINPEHIIKYEYQQLGGSIYGMSWSEDSKRIALAGHGREQFANVIAWDTGSNIGSLSGHTKTCLNVDFRKARPYSIVTCGEDQTIINHKGPPFKYDKTHRLHSNFVNSVRFNSDSSLLASAGMDGKIFIFDGKTLDLLYELIDENDKKAHAGGVYSISWSPCSKKLLSASGDKKCKIWDVESKTIETVFEMGSQVTDQQLASIWIKEHIISVSGSGKINFLDQSNPSCPKRTFWGHNRGIVYACLTEDKKTLVTSSYEGNLNHWNLETGECTPFTESKIASQITAFSIKGDNFIAVAVGKLVQFGSVSAMKFNPETFSLCSEPCSVLLIEDNIAVAGSVKSLELIVDKKIVDTHEITFEATSLFQYGNGSNIVVGGSDGKARFYKIESNKLVKEDKEINVGVPIVRITLSHDGKNFLFSTSKTRVYIYDVETLQSVVGFVAQSSRVNYADYSPDDKHVATCGVDGVVNVYKVDDRFYRIEIRLAHRAYNATAVFWLSPNTILSVGQQDCCIKFWEVKL